MGWIVGNMWRWFGGDEFVFLKLYELLQINEFIDCQIRVQLNEVEQAILYVERCCLFAQDRLR